MDRNLSVGIMFGVAISVPLWISLIGWIQIMAAGVGLLLKALM